MARSDFCAVAFRFSDSPAVCWLVRSRCGIGFGQSRAERALFSSVENASAVGGRMARDLAAAGVRSFRWAVVRIQ